MFCFNSAWTTLFSTTYMLWYVDGASHFLANVASSVFWLMATSALWVCLPLMFWVAFHLMQVKGHGCRYHAQHKNGNRLCRTRDDIQMSTVFDGGSLGMDRVWIVRGDNGGDLFMGEFKLVEETVFTSSRRLGTEAGLAIT